MILALMISFVIPVKRVRPIRGSALVHINAKSLFHITFYIYINIFDKRKSSSQSL